MKTNFSRLKTSILIFFICLFVKMEAIADGPGWVEGPSSGFGKGLGIGITICIVGYFIIKEIDSKQNKK
ncbi:hypothetical protein [Luteibaculum oceani]|uniref:Uncharacterized protein n=1 Tax=Luteibaculum oceani TaxID=1294296 RepID=A0A5C6V1D9_9FLAO|nr:hypothetical protein [Luteibaculum oceani]TXC78774.1 hypothetical protein FRX97_06035 [Luteibaculum oceani]